MEPVVVGKTDELAEDPFIEGEVKSHRTPKGQIFIKLLGKPLHRTSSAVGQGREIERKASTSCCA